LEKNKNQKGFTLIELLIVIVIIGILAGVSLSVINPAKQQRKANEAVLKANTDKLCMAMYACVSATTDPRNNCNSVAESGAINVDGKPAGAAYYIWSDATYLYGRGILAANSGSDGRQCYYRCDYNHTTGVTTSLREVTSTTYNCVADDN